MIQKFRVVHSHGIELQKNREITMLGFIQNSNQLLHAFFIRNSQFYL